MQQTLPLLTHKTQIFTEKGVKHLYMFYKQYNPVKTDQLGPGPIRINENPGC